MRLLKTETANVSILFLVFFVSITASYAQNNPTDWKQEKRAAVLFGLTQPLLARGFNIEGNLIYKRWIVDYSHGVSLDFGNATLPTKLKDQKLAIHMPYTTGFGVGYRFTKWLNVRIEPKWHRFEFYYEDEAQTTPNRITSYQTFSLGMGVYGFFRPFEKQNNFLSGIILAPSIRFWPNVNSSLKGEDFTYANKFTDRQEKIEELGPGIFFTPLIINLSVGYSIKL
jgi:hypothetical protein